MVTLLRSILHAAKGRIYVLVVPLEPVAKCRPQHARCRARRTALHDEVLAIKEISGITTVERKRLEARKWGKDRRSPLPSIAQHVMHTERALAVGKCIHGCGVPLVKIEVAKLLVGRITAPGIILLAPVGSRIGCAMPLLLCRKCLPRPARIRCRFSVAHIDRPIQR